MRGQCLHIHDRISPQLTAWETFLFFPHPGAILALPSLCWADSKCQLEGGNWANSSLYPLEFQVLLYMVLELKEGDARLCQPPRNVGYVMKE